MFAVSHFTVFLEVLLYGKWCILGLVIKNAWRALGSGALMNGFES